MRQKDNKFKVSLGNLARLCLKTETKEGLGCSSMVEHPSLIFRIKQKVYFFINSQFSPEKQALSMSMSFFKRGGGGLNQGTNLVLHLYLAPFLVFQGWLLEAWVIL